MHRLRKIIPAKASFVRRSLMVAAVMASTGVLVRADEPNDALAKATPIDPMKIQPTLVASRLANPFIDGVIGDGPFPEHDVDLYRLDFVDRTQPFVLTVDVRAGDAGFDPFVRVFDADGIVLAVNDDRAPGDTNPRILVPLPWGGIYFVGVSAAANPRYDPLVGGSGRVGSGGPYTMTLATEERIDAVSALEPNDRTLDATFMGTESFAVAGEFIGDGENGALDVDIYELRLTGAAKIDVRLQAEAMGSLLDPVVRLRTCDEAIETRTQVDPCLLGVGDHLPDGSRGVAFSAGVLTKQTVFILVSGAGNRRYDPVTAGSGEPGSMGTYDLQVHVRYFDRTGPGEPNDSIPTATKGPLFVDGRPTVFEVDGVIGDGPMAPFRGDRDFYGVILVDEPRMLTIDVTSTSIGSALDPVVTVYDFAGNEIATSDRHDGTVEGHIQVIASCFAVIQDTVSVYVMVSGTRQRPPGDVNRPFRGQASVLADNVEGGPGSVGSYHLTITADPIEATCGSDPGDTLATAAETGLVDQGEFACTDAFLGDASCDDAAQDLDLWALDVTQAPVLLSVTPSLCGLDALGGIGLAVFDSSGRKIAQVHVDRHHSVTSPRRPPLRMALTAPGRYYVALGDHIPSFQLSSACSVRGGDQGSYHLIVKLTPDRNRSGSSGEASGVVERDVALPTELFTTRLDGANNRIDAIDAETGERLRELPTPEPRVGGAEGLAFDGENLFYVGAGKFPKLYRLDPLTGDVLDQNVLWMGSGFYSDAVLLDGELFFLDFGERSVHVLDPLSLRHDRTLHVGGLGGPTIAGGLGALAHPSRLYVADAFNTRRIFELDPHSGAITNELGPFTRRPAAVGGAGDLLLYVSDSHSPKIDVLLRDGSPAETLPVEAPVGTLGGEPFGSFFADFDGDGDIDLIDQAAFQRCFGDGTGQNAICTRGDRNDDGRIDLLDYAQFVGAVTGP